MKFLFDKNDNRTKIGSEIGRELYSELFSILKKYQKDGWSLHHLKLIGIYAIMESHLDTLGRRNKEKNEKII